MWPHRVDFGVPSMGRWTSTEATRDGSSINSELGSLTKNPHLPLSKDLSEPFLSSYYHRSSYRGSFSSIFYLSSRTILQTKGRVPCHRLAQNPSWTSPSTNIQLAEIPSVVHQTSPPASSPFTTIVCHSHRDFSFRRCSNILLKPLAPSPLAINLSSLHD